jgi:hypothetical protein
MRVHDLERLLQRVHAIDRVLSEGHREGDVRLVAERCDVVRQMHDVSDRIIAANCPLHTMAARDQIKYVASSHC